MKKLVLLASLCFAISSFGYASEDIANANFLADQGVVTKQTVLSQYRLDDKILRQEVIGMALKVKGITLPENYTCKKYFADATKNDWVCRAVELAADNGIITRSNKYANPGKYVTRVEALAMVMKSSGEYESTTQGPSFYDANTWQTLTLLTAHDHFPVIFKDTPSDINPDCEMNPCTRYYFKPNQNATRADVFAFAKNIINNSSGQSYEGFTADFGGDVDMSDGFYAFGEIGQAVEAPEGLMTHKFHITVQSRKSASIYDSGSIPLMEKYWNHNMYYTTMIEGMCFTGKLIFLTDEYVISASGECNQTILEIEDALRLISFNPNNTETLQNKDVLRQYYRFIMKDISSAYSMRSPVVESLATFESWYKNTDSVIFREDTLKDLGDNTYEFLVDMTENGIKSTFKVKSKVNIEKFTIDNISSVKQ